MIDHDLLYVGAPVVTPYGQQATITSRQRHAYGSRWLAAGVWWQASQLVRTDDPDRVIPGRSRV